MKKNILLTANYRGRPLEIVRELVPEGFTLIMMSTFSQEELEEKAAQADYILASGNLEINARVLEAARNLVMVQRLGVGLDSLDLSALKDRNIPVYVNRGVNSNSVAEHTLMFMLACLRNLTLINQRTKSGIWKKQEQGVTTRELAEQTVGIIGIGNIGKRVISFLKPFGCRILYYDPYRMSEKEELELQIEYKALDELFALADIITLHCPLTNDTKNIICKANINKMKDGVIIINTSRGHLISENDLLDALNTGKIGFAGLDVYCEEPLSNFALACHEHVVCTPHIAGNTLDSFSRMMQYAFRNILLHNQGRMSEIEEYLIKRKVK